MEGDLLIWFDAKVNIPINVDHQTLFAENFTFKAFTNYHLAIDFIKSKKKRVIILTSGTDGEPFTKKLLEIDYYVKFIIAFTTSKEMTSTWSASYPKVKGIASHIDEVLSNIERFRKESIIEEAMVTLKEGDVAKSLKSWLKVACMKLDEIEEESGEITCNEDLENTCFGLVELAFKLTSSDAMKQRLTDLINLK